MFFPIGKSRKIILYEFIIDHSNSEPDICTLNKSQKFLIPFVRSITNKRDCNKDSVTHHLFVTLTVSLCVDIAECSWCGGVTEDHHKGQLHENCQVCL